MNLKKIKEIIDSNVSDSIKTNNILESFADEKNVIPYVLSILQKQTNMYNNLISDMNLELSRSHIYIENDGIGSLDKPFVLEKIEEFYTKYKSSVTHCFNRFN